MTQTHHTHCNSAASGLCAAVIQSLLMLIVVCLPTLACQDSPTTPLQRNVIGQLEHVVLAYHGKSGNLLTSIEEEEPTATGQDTPPWSIKNAWQLILPEPTGHAARPCANTLFAADSYGFFTPLLRAPPSL
ncbi:MAG: hypothetical protein ACK5ME_09770 [Parahaliea sp.]